MEDEFEKEFPSLKGMVIQDTHGLNDSIACEDLKDCCIDKKKVLEVIDNIKPKKYRENNRCFTPKELEVYTNGSHKFTPSMAIFILTEVERYIERIKKELKLED